MRSNLALDRTAYRPPLSSTLGVFMRVSAMCKPICCRCHCDRVKDAVFTFNGAYDGINLAKDDWVNERQREFVADDLHAPKLCQRSGSPIQRDR